MLDSPNSQLSVLKRDKDLQCGFVLTFYDETIIRFIIMISRFKSGPVAL